MTVRILAIASLMALVTVAQDHEWTDLLAGNSLDQWRGYKQQQTPPQWKLTDGVLTMAGSSGDLIARQQYGDIDFRFEWKVAKGANSGVIYRVTETDGPTYHTGPEYQLLDDDVRVDGGSELTAAASLYGLYARSKVVAKPARANSPPGKALPRTSVGILRYRTKAAVFGSASCVSRAWMNLRLTSNAIGVRAPRKWDYLSALLAQRLERPLFCFGSQRSSLSCALCFCLFEPQWPTGKLRRAMKSSINTGAAGIDYNSRPHALAEM